MKVSSRILQAFEHVPEAGHYVVALSGGLDSVVLLHAFRLFKPSVSLEVIHVHHGLSPNADHWARHCQGICEALSIPCYIKKVSVSNEGEGLEAAARKARYAVFESCLNQGEVLLQGHHQNDQAETVLIRALRGSGVKGLAAIPVSRSLGCGALVHRPLLEVSRQDLLSEAKRLGLEWVEDESNTDRGFDRNYLRHEVLPVLEGRWPKAVAALAQVSKNAAETQGFIEAWCARQFEGALLTQRDDESLVLNIASLLNYSATEQKLLLRAWIDRCAYPQPSARIFDRIFAELIPARPDASPVLRWGECELRRYAGALFCQPKAPVLNQAYQLSVCFEQFGEQHELSLPCKTLSCVYAERDADVAQTYASVCIAVPEGGFELTLKSRRGGESLKLHPGRPGRSLKSLFQASAIPPWQRDAYPLIYINGDLAAVGGLWVGADFHANSASPVLSICVKTARF